METRNRKIICKSSEMARYNSTSNVSFDKVSCLNYKKNCEIMLENFAPVVIINYRQDAANCSPHDNNPCECAYQSDRCAFNTATNQCVGRWKGNILCET